MSLHPAAVHGWRADTWIPHPAPGSPPASTHHISRLLNSHYTCLCLLQTNGGVNQNLFTWQKRHTSSTSLERAFGPHNVQRTWGLSIHLILPHFYLFLELWMKALCNLCASQLSLRRRNDLMLLQQFDAEGWASPVVPGPRSQLHPPGAPAQPRAQSPPVGGDAGSVWCLEEPLGSQPGLPHLSLGVPNFTSPTTTLQRESIHERTPTYQFPL